MASKPQSEDVQYFMEITNTDRSTALKFLDRFGGVDPAINAYFDNNGKLVPETTTWPGPDTWDERQFHGDRMHGPENRPATSFQVHAQDNMEALGPTLFASNLSRPNSRVDDRMDTSEDTDLQQAISRSLGQSADGQETGVTDGKNFRPAERSEYPTDQWAMIISKPVMPNPEPENRKRMEGAPAFLKPSGRQHYLPALLTILQEIPMAKEALLAREAILQDYGIGEEWWDGEAIRIRRVVALGEEEPPDVLILIECQRIMAFLELTERAYGNVSVLGQLAETDGDEYGNKTNTVEGAFLDAWSAAVRQTLPTFQLGDIFAIRVTELDSLNPDGEPEKGNYNIVKISSDPPNQLFDQPFSEESTTLYDCLDSALWGAWNYDNPRASYLEFSDVLVFNIEACTPSEQGSGNLCDCPATLYVDRYLEESLAKAKDMLQKQHVLREKVKEGKIAQERFRSVQKLGNKGKSFDAKELLKVVKPFFAGTESMVDEEDSSEITSGESYHNLDAYREIGKTLQEIADRVMAKFQALEDEKDRAMKEIRELSHFSKEVTGTAEDPAHRFTLRGVATDPTTTFILANPNTTEDLIDTDLKDWQWWKIAFTPGEIAPIDYEKVEEELVLATVKNSETRKALLVYASDKAMAYPTEPLPSSLRNFVRADNLNFSSELEQSRRPISSSSSKRKVDEAWEQFIDMPSNQNPRWGGDSPDSTTVQLDDDDNPPPLVHANSENSPPPYSPYPPGPPPIPPRINKKRPAPSTDSKGSAGLVEDGNEAQANDGEFKDIDLLGVESKEMQEMNSNQAPVFGTGGAGDAAKGSYASSLRVSDVDDFTASDPQKGNEDLMQL